MLPFCVIEMLDSKRVLNTYSKRPLRHPWNVSMHFATFIGREITTVLKIALDNVILELCDSSDYFASPLLL